MSPGNGLVQLTAKDFKSDQEVRWCPGCGDYAILAGVQSFLPELGVPRENLVFISGIGCAARFPYYVQTFGMHSIHGRAPAIATGLATSRSDLSVWVVTGDGDALSIGGNHLIHALRRNVNVKILLFNNQIYGLTKGQYSPTSELGKVTKSTPMGSLDHPFNPVSLAIGAEATFVARSIDTDRKHLTSVLRRAAAHKGTAFVEIYQNCNIFNDGAFDAVKEHPENQIRLEHAEPILRVEEFPSRTRRQVALALLTVTLALACVAPLLEYPDIDPLKEPLHLSFGMLFLGHALDQDRAGIARAREKGLRAPAVGDQRHREPEQERRGDPTARDAVAYLVHTPTDLYLGVTGLWGPAPAEDPQDFWLGLFLDPRFTRAGSPEPEHARVMASLSHEVLSRWWNGDGDGGARALALVHLHVESLGLEIPLVLGDEEPGLRPLVLPVQDEANLHGIGGLRRGRDRSCDERQHRPAQQSADRHVFSPPRFVGCR